MLILNIPRKPKVWLSRRMRVIKISRNEYRSGLFSNPHRRESHGETGRDGGHGGFAKANEEV
jgi:hypothetical protein